MLTPKQLYYRLKHRFLLLIGVRKPPISYPVIDCCVELIEGGVLLITPRDMNHPRKFNCELGCADANGLITRIDVFDKLREQWVTLELNMRIMKTNQLRLTLHCGLLEDIA